MTQIISTLVLAAALLFGCGSKAQPVEPRAPKTEQQIYNSVVQLSVDGQNFCSGQNVKAPSGKVYILSAGHCADAVRRSGAVAITEQGKRYKLVVVQEDPNSDLLLMKGIRSLPALEIAHSVMLRQKIRTFTHGLGMLAYETAGQLIEYRKVDIMGSDFITSPEDAEKCLSQKKHSIVNAGWVKICAISTWSVFSTAFTAPGSSGGAIVDDMGDLVGVVSGGGMGYSVFVRLSDIQRFLAKR